MKLGIKNDSGIARRTIVYDMDDPDRVLEGVNKIELLTIDANNPSRPYLTARIELQINALDINGVLVKLSLEPIQGDPNDEE